MGIQLQHPVHTGGKTLQFGQKKLSESNQSSHNISFTGYQPCFTGNISARQALVHFTSLTKTTPASLIKQINPDRLQAHVEYLASDDLAGRLPDTEGISKAQDYIIENFHQAGLNLLNHLPIMIIYRKLSMKLFTVNARGIRKLADIKKSRMA
jgi:hypothetical protein